MKSNSIQSRLILRLIIPMILFNLVIFAFVFLLFDRKINDFFDQTLLASAKSIEDKVLVEYGTLIVNIPYFTIDMLENTSKGHVFYSVENEKGEIVAGFDDIPNPKNENLNVDFSFENKEDKDFEDINHKKSLKEVTFLLCILIEKFKFKF